MKRKAPSYQEDRQPFHNETKLLVDFFSFYIQWPFFFTTEVIILYPLIFCVIAIAILIHLPSQHHNSKIVVSFVATKNFILQRVVGQILKY